MRWIPAAFLLASLAVATVPYTLAIGVPAKASQVNRNFATLDSLVGEQIDQVTELRQLLVAQTDSLRKDLAGLRQKVKADSFAAAERVRAEFAADTGWKTLNLPKGTVIGLLASAGPDGYLAGSDKTWQQVEAFGGVDGLPSANVAPAASPVVAAPAPAAGAAADSAGLAKASTDTAHPAAVSAPASTPAASPVAPPVPSAVPAPLATQTKPVFHWFVKVK